MLKISECPLSRLHNEEHYKFMTDVNGLITYFTAASLLIVAEYASFTESHANEGEALNFVRKSTYSDQLHVVDLRINETLEGIENAIDSGLKHYSQPVREAATRLNVRWQTVGDIKRKSQQDKSGAIIKLITDFRSTYSADVNTVGISGWVDELSTENMTHETIEKSRINEQDSKTHQRMSQARIVSDAKYHTITEKINAMIIVNGQAPFVSFVNKLNLSIDAYTNNLAIRHGKGKKPTDPTTEPKA